MKSMDLSNIGYCVLSRFCFLIFFFLRVQFTHLSTSTSHHKKAVESALLQL